MDLEEHNLDLRTIAETLHYEILDVRREELLRELKPAFCTNSTGRLREPCEKPLTGQK